MNLLVLVGYFNIVNTYKHTNKKNTHTNAHTNIFIKTHIETDMVLPYYYEMFKYFLYPIPLKMGRALCVCHDLCNTSKYWYNI